MGESSGPQGRSLLDTLSLSTSAALPVELLSAAASTTASQTKTPSQSLTSTPGHEETAPTRKSGRAIKRKKFDDEIVDTSTHGGSLSIPPLSTNFPVPSLPSPTLASPTATTIVSGNQSPSSPTVSTPVGSHLFHASLSIPSRNVSSRLGKGVGKKAASKKSGVSADSRISTSKKLKQQKKKPRKDEAHKDLGRWKPTDDLALITAVLQTNDIATVHRGMKFSCHFTLHEVETRWRAILYNQVISKLALQAIRNLPPEVVLAVQRKTLLSPQEKEILSTIKANRTPSPTVDEFQDLLLANPGVFHSARTAECLQRQWQSLRQFNLLPDQSVQPLPRDNHILNFLDAESSINDSELAEPRDEFLFHEMALSDRKSKREIRHLEAEVQKWQILVDAVRGDNPPDFDNQTLAVLRGRLVRYLMRSKEITVGRSTKDQSVDVDLKLEGPAWKISRRQGVIKLRTSGEFFFTNEGKRHIFVDGCPISRSTSVRLNNNSVLEISGLKFVFLINQDLIEAIRQEATRIYQTSAAT